MKVQLNIQLVSDRNLLQIDADYAEGYDGWVVAGKRGVSDEVNTHQKPWIALNFESRNSILNLGPQRQEIRNAVCNQFQGFSLLVLYTTTSQGLIECDDTEVFPVYCDSEIDHSLPLSKSQAVFFYDETCHS